MEKIIKVFFYTLNVKKKKKEFGDVTKDVFHSDLAKPT